MEAARLDAARAEQVLHQGAQAAGRALRGAGDLRELVGWQVGVALTEDVERVLEHGERRAQLVRDAVQELLAHRVQGEVMLALAPRAHEQDREGVEDDETGEAVPRRDADREVARRGDVGGDPDERRRRGGDRRVRLAETPARDSDRDEVEEREADVGPRHVVDEADRDGRHEHDRDRDLSAHPAITLTPRVSAAASPPRGGPAPRARDP